MRQLGFFDLCRMKILQLVKVESIFFFSPVISRAHKVVSRSCMIL